ncbi:MAG: carboxyl transferase domain-containing protein [Planctomycetota bacterium]
MAKVPLTPIGRDRAQFLDDASYAKNRAALGAKIEELETRRAAVAAGWGESYRERVHAKGKRTARERIDALKDAGTRIFEVGTFVNDGRLFGKLTSPAAGVITAYVQVAGRWTMVIANDNTVASGSWWPQTPEKIERAQEMALRLRLPVIYLVDCSGLFLPEQSHTFPGRTGAGHIFQKNSLLSAQGVPQIAGVFGDCIAGGGYMPIISDRVYMTEQAYMVIAGAALIQGAKSQKLSSLDIGGPEVHVHQSGCADVRVPDDDTAIERIRREVMGLPSSAAPFYRHGNDGGDPLQPAAELDGLFPTDHRHVYDIGSGDRPPGGPQPVLGTVVRTRARDRRGRRPGERPVHGFRRHAPGPDPGPRAPWQAEARGHPVPRRHRQTRRLQPRVQRRRHPSGLAAGHLRFRHRRGKPNARACLGTARV